MEDRKASVLAAAVGCAAVGGFWLARPAVPKAVIKVIEQTMPSARSGKDGDAAATFRIELPHQVRDAMEDGQVVVLQVVDRAGRVYPLVPTEAFGYNGRLELPRGYASKPENPRIVAASNGAILASAPVRDLPPPTPISLDVRPDPRIAAVYRGLGWLEARNLVPLAADERWHIEARRTRFANLAEVHADIPILSSRWQTQRLLVPYPEQAEAIELEVTRSRLVERSVTVEIPNLRIAPLLGGTALIVDQAFDATTGLGTIHVPKQVSGPRRPVRRGNPRIASASMLFVTQDPTFDETERRARARLGYSMRVEIVSPSPESLGLREFRLGVAGRASSTEPRGPLSPRKFSVVLRITAVEPKPFDQFTATVPIVRGEPLTEIPSAATGTFSGDPPNDSSFHRRRV